MWADYFEWLGALSGLVGAFLLATNTKASRYGWWAFLSANIFMVGLAILIDRRGLLLQQLGFTVTSLLGLYRTGFVPRLSWRRHGAR